MIGCGGAAEKFLGLIERVIPDPQAKAAAALELQKMAQAGEFKEIDAALELARQQNEVNREEAKSADPFTSRWRPCVGYVCAAGLAYASILEPVIRVLAPMLGHSGPLPAVDTTLTMQLLFGLLGLGGFRTYEKTKRTA